MPLLLSCRCCKEILTWHISQRKLSIGIEFSNIVFWVRRIWEYIVVRNNVTIVLKWVSVDNGQKLFGSCPSCDIMQESLTEVLADILEKTWTRSFEGTLLFNKRREYMQDGDLTQVSKTSTNIFNLSCSSHWQHASSWVLAVSVSQLAYVLLILIWSTCAIPDGFVLPDDVNACS